MRQIRTIYIYDGLFTTGMRREGYVCRVRTRTGLVKILFSLQISFQEQLSRIHNDISYFEGEKIVGTTDEIISFQHNFIPTSVLNKYYTFTQNVCRP